MIHFAFYGCLFSLEMRFRDLAEGSPPLIHLISFFFTSNVCFQRNYYAFLNAQEKMTRLLKGGKGNKHYECESKKLYSIFQTLWHVLSEV